ncbi:MAG: hypothetical protein ACTSXJ_02640 [Candidatus Baldrarchaeia archaeon]
MSEFLGKVEIKEEDLPMWLRSKDSAFMGSIVKWFLEEMLMRIEIVLPRDLQKKFEEKVQKIYGKVSAANIRRAALQAIKEWCEK